MRCANHARIGLFRPPEDTVASPSARSDLTIFGFFNLLVLLPIYLLFAIAYLSYTSKTRNIGFNNLYLEGGHQFRSTVTVSDYSWIFITNTLLSIFTLGLFIPWAQVRMARYLADNTSMIANGNLDDFAAGQTDGSGVTSGEFLDIEGFDFGF